MNDRHKHAVAKALRKNFTSTERFLWRHLRAKQMEGYKFRRQEPIGNYIVDFVCHEKMIVIEVDGGQHSVEQKKIPKETDGLRSRDIRSYDSGTTRY